MENEIHIVEIVKQVTKAHYQIPVYQSPCLVTPQAVQISSCSRLSLSTI
jgi:hypothetical protein